MCIKGIRVTSHNVQYIIETPIIYQTNITKLEAYTSNSNIFFTKKQKHIFYYFLFFEKKTLKNNNIIRAKVSNLYSPEFKSEFFNKH